MPIFKRFAIRFVHFYFVLTIFPFPLLDLPGGETAWTKYDQMWIALFQWINDHWLHLQFATEPSGSGDKTVDYFRVVALAALALVLSLLWRKFDKYDRWVQLYVRWYLAAMLILYGFYKFFPGQFAPLNLSRLVEPIGEMSPMGLLWTMMGFSRPYAFFGGSMELVAGIMLLVPRLTTLGAAAAFAAMLNVFMLNMCYDVPVKIFSFQLVLYALYLLALDRDRLLKFFVLGKAVPAAATPPLFKSSSRNRAALWVQAALAVVLVLKTGWTVHNGANEAQIAIVEPRFHGVWRLDDIAEIDNPPHWKRLTFATKDRMTLQLENGRLVRFRMKGGKDSNAFEIQKFDQSDPYSKITIEQPTTDLLKITGNVDGHALHLTAHLETDLDFPLMNRGFHWINEVPLNR